MASGTKRAQRIRQPVIVAANLRNSATALAATSCAALFSMLSYPVRSWKARQHQIMEEVAMEAFKTGFATGLGQGQQQGYGAGMQEGFLLGQQNMLDQFRAQQHQKPPDNERWRMN